LDVTILGAILDEKVRRHKLTQPSRTLREGAKAVPRNYAKNTKPSIGEVAEVQVNWPERTTVTTEIYSGSRRGYLSYFEQWSDSREKERKDQLPAAWV